MITKPQRVRLANYLYGGTEDSDLVPSSFWIGLSTTTMDDSGAITGEVSGNGYARVELVNNKTNLSTATTNSTSVYNKTNVTWPEATASWGTIKTVFIAASSTATTALYYVTVNKEIAANTTLYFKGDVNSGDLTLTITN